MKPDITVSWDKHLKNGNVWRAEVELGMQDTPGEEPYVYTVEVPTGSSSMKRAS